MKIVALLMPLQTFQELLEQLALHIWNNLRDGWRLNISQGEETFTDRNLLALAQLSEDYRAAGLRPLVQVIKCPKNLEAKTGIDWDWFIGSRRSGWYRLAVQAKRVNSIARYEGLTKKVPTSSGPGERQLDVLETFARTQRAAPIYCLYNFVDEASFTSHWHCCNLTFQHEQLGCTITSASVVRTAIRRHGGKTFDQIHRERVTLPWRCLACPKVLPLQENAMAQSEHTAVPEEPTRDSTVSKAYLTNHNLHEILPGSLDLLLSEKKLSKQALSSIYRSAYGLAPAIPKRVGVFDLEADVRIK